MNTVLRCALAAAGVALAPQALAQVTFYEHDGFQGRSFTTEGRVGDLEREGFNDRASSVVVLRDRWEACEDARFGGRCVILRPGRYPSLGAMGLNDRVSSVRIVERNARVDDERYAPAPIPVYDNRRRQGERLFEAEVVAVRAIVGQPQQRCWVEREQVSRHDDGRANVPGAIVGALVGGVLGHQVGGGRGKDVATAGGAVAGAALGANVGRNDGRGPTYTHDVRRCSNVPDQVDPEYWDVTYHFRGQEHHMQMAHPPGRTVTVNSRGEPRG